MSAAPPAFDDARYRQVLGHFPTGVTVITAMGDGQPAGLAVGSFASASLDPPLVGFFANRSSSSWPRIEASGSFCVNILADDQEEVCRRFASKGDDKFGGLGWHPARSGAPILAGVLAWIDCDIESVTPAGDHVCVLGRIREMDIGHEGGPRVVDRGGYGRFAV